MVGKGLRSNPGLKPSLAKRVQAGLAELLLVNRLRSLASRHQAADILKRAAAVVWLTCKSWFGTGEADKTRPPGPKR